MTSRKRPEVKFAPREVFENVPEYAVIPTFDLVVELPEDGGVVLARRTIAPYRNKRALPGLRMFKPEGVDDVIARIAEDELGLDVDVDGKRFLGQYAGRCKTEHEWQDLSARYVASALSTGIRINPDHFSGHQTIKRSVPPATVAMYRPVAVPAFVDLRRVVVFTRRKTTTRRRSTRRAPPGCRWCWSG